MKPSGLTFYLFLIAANGFGQDESSQLPDIMRVYESHSNLLGQTGMVNTATALLSANSGRLLIIENLSDESLERICVSITAFDIFECGAISGMPYRPNANPSLFFTLSPFLQDQFFVGLPRTAFGMNSKTAFAAMSYDFGVIATSLGYNISDGHEGIFGGIEINPIEYVGASIDYDGSENLMGFGLQANFWHFSIKGFLSLSLEPQTQVGWDSVSIGIMATF